MRKYLLASDSHGDAIDLKTAKALLSRKDDLKPDVLIHLGDAFDFASIRRGASPEEKALSMIDDYEAGLEFLEQFYKGRGEKYYLVGNHCDRLWQVAEGADGPRSDAAKMIIEKLKYFFRRMGVKVTPFDSRNGVLRLKEFAFVHGYCHAQNAAKQHAETYGGTARTVFAGDLHARLYWRSASIDPIECYHLPCMTGLDPEYAKRHRSKLRHSQGWGEINYYGKGAYDVQIIENKGGKYRCFSQVKEY
jgi:hypothetical protein